MKFSPRPKRMAGFGLIEFMIAMALGVIVTGGVIEIFIAERQVYQSASSQTLIQDSDNAIGAVITPIVRGAGFTGCGTINNGVASYIGAAPPSILTYSTSSDVQGFTGTLPAQMTDNAANDATAGDWTPALDASLTGSAIVEKGSDVLTLIGAAPGTTPVGVINFAAGAITVDDASKLLAGNQLMAVSDCGKSSMFMATGVTAATGVVTFATGPNGTPLYGLGTQLIPMQQTVFFVGQGHGGQSALFRGVMTPGAGAGNGVAGAKWTNSETVPGVIAMKVLYGVATNGNGQATEYFDASHVVNWPSVTTIKLAFLLEGNLGSSPIPAGAQTYSLLGSAVTVPADSRLRHIFNMTVNARNNTL
jgi:type IV pilus assembly protein PilW